MTTTIQHENITLYYRQGSSDKVYQAAVQPSGPGFIVTFAYGRRGSTMTTGTKTPQPVEFAAAKKIFDRLVQEKTAKGYTPGEEGTPYQQTPKAERSTGILPQLLNPIDEETAQKLLTDSDWWAQEKFDGRRVLIRKAGDQITGINRQGLVIALPASIVARARDLGSQQWLMDGEAVGDVLHVFDILENACRDLRCEPFSKRMKALKELFGLDEPRAAIHLAETTTTHVTKRSLLASLKAANREGIVFKRHSAPYTPGRPASGGDQLKLKFTATASYLVAGANGSKRSVALELLDGHKNIGVGSVTIPPSQPIPQAGQIVEVRYLYAYAGGSLYQPVYLGVRDDVEQAACTVTQLKLKPGDDGEESEAAAD